MGGLLCCVCRPALSLIDGAKVGSFLVAAKLFGGLFADTRGFLDRCQHIPKRVDLRQPEGFLGHKFGGLLFISYLYRLKQKLNRKDMEKTNQYLEIAYQLYVDGDNGLELMEETGKDRPFQFITGFGIALDAFEKQVGGLAKDSEFDFTIPKDEAYGDFLEERVLDLDREMFTVDGKFDEERVYEDAMIPLQNEEGQRFFGRVVEIGAKSVKVDLNHPLAGEDLHFRGRVLESRPATAKEIESLAAQLRGGCGGCSGGYSGGSCECGGCGG